MESSKYRVTYEIRTPVGIERRTVTVSAMNQHDANLFAYQIMRKNGCVTRFCVKIEIVDAKEKVETAH